MIFARTLAQVPFVQDHPGIPEIANVKLAPLGLAGAGTALHKAVTHGHEKIVRALLQKQAYVHAVDDNQRTPLHFAAAMGNHRMVIDLLEFASPTNTQDCFGKTALDYAIARGDLQTVELLIEHGSNVN